MSQHAKTPRGSTLADPGGSTRLRILAATAEVMGRHGMTKLSLTAVALEAKVSRPTLYRWFPTKKDLLDAYVAWERSLYERAVAEATAGLPPSERLDAALRVIAAGQQAYPGLRMVDIEPELVIDRLAGAIPSMRAGLERLLPGPDGAQAAATVVRVAVSHYLVRGDDADEFLSQLRHAARTRQPISKSRDESSAVRSGTREMDAGAGHREARALVTPVTALEESVPRG